MNDCLSHRCDLFCDCQAVRLAVYGAPRLSAYCHCETCRSAYAVEVLSASAWPTAQVEIAVEPGRRLIECRHADKRLWRYTCDGCGRLVHARNRRGYVVIPNVRFRSVYGQTLPADLAPASHFFHARRVLEISDDLPKHEGDDGYAHADSARA